MIRTAVQLGFNGYGIFGRLPESDLPDTLRLVESGGFDGVEVMSNVAARRDSVDVIVRNGTPVAALHLFLNELESADAITRWSAVMTDLGCDRLAVSAFGMEQSADGYTELATRLGLIRDRLRAADQELYFHCHAAELSIVAADDRRGVDVLTTVLPDLRLVIDTHWTSVAGLSPEHFIRENSARSGYYHFKDGVGTEGAVFGEGTVPMDACLAAALTGRVDWVVLEQDRPAPDVALVFQRFGRLVHDIRQQVSR